MNFDDAIKAHSAWKTKLAAYLQSPDGALKAEEIEVDNRCELGKWLHASHAEHGHHPEFHVIKDDHARFHRAAAGVVKRAHQGLKVTEEVALGAKSEFGTVSEKLVLGMMGLRRKLSSKPPAGK